MKKNSIRKTGIVLSAVILFAAGCGQSDSRSSQASVSDQSLTENIQPTQNTQEQAEEMTEISEGADTICEITGYSEYSGENKDMFLKKGDRIAVIAPSSYPTREQTDATIEGLRQWGYEPVEGDHVCDEKRTLADCRADIEKALTDDSIKGIFCVRGGYGGSEVMDELSLDMLKDSRKLIIGYSDITSYHAGWTSAGLPSLHACMSGTFTDLPDECKEAEQKMMMGEIPAYRCSSTEYNKQGSAEGILIGGNLSTFLTVINTAYDCTKKGVPYILFFEDVGENITHLHRYLTILKNAGVLEKAEGIIFGEWTEVPYPLDYDSRGEGFKSISDMISKQILPDINVPVAFGFPAGHADTNYPLLMGEKAKLTVEKDNFTLSWT